MDINQNLYRDKQEKDKNQSKHKYVEQVKDFRNFVEIKELL